MSYDSLASSHGDISCHAQLRFSLPGRRHLLLLLFHLFQLHLHHFLLLLRVNLSRHLKPGRPSDCVDISRGDPLEDSSPDKDRRLPMSCTAPRRWPSVHPGPCIICSRAQVVWPLITARRERPACPAKRRLTMHAMSITACLLHGSPARLRFARRWRDGQKRRERCTKSLLHVVVDEVLQQELIDRRASAPSRRPTSTLFASAPIVQCGGWASTTTDGPMLNFPCPSRRSSPSV